MGMERPGNRAEQIAGQLFALGKVQSAAEIDRLLNLTGPNLALLLDTGHATFAGADPVSLARRHRARITHIHCKDVREPVMREALRVARGLPSLDACLERELETSCAFLGAPDFAEGIRAAVIDKDRTPRWSPDRLEDVSPEAVDRYVPRRNGGGTP